MEHIPDQNLEWWADEIWRLNSRWAPVGRNLFVTFLVDPIWDGLRKKGQGVWAIGASAQMPTSRQEAQRLGLLHRHAMKLEIEAFLEKLEQLRNTT